MVRRARPEDAAAIAAIQRSSAEAAQWDPAGYEVQVAESDGKVVGFLVTRAVAADEIEILNLAVADAHRRSGIGSALVQSVVEHFRGDVFLEVRESNTAARKLYERLRFEEVSRRQEYYENPTEACVVMKFHSC